MIVSLVMPVFAARDNYNQAWKEFNENNRDRAREYFEKAVQSEPESKSEALFSLVLLDWFESKDKDAFIRFQEFYQSADNPYPYLYSVYFLPFMSPKQGLSSTEVVFFEKIVNDPKMHGTLKAMICEKLGEYYTSRNDFQKSKQVFEKMGVIFRWQVLGGFDNISGSGFDKDWGVLEKAVPGSKFKNKVDAEISWHTPSVTRPDGRLYFHDYFVLNNVVAYAQSFVQSADEGEVIMRVATAGSLKIWVNDVQVSNVQEERSCNLDTYSYKVKLNKGNNRILVQIGQSELQAASFKMRLTDIDGNPVSGLTYSADYSEYTKSNAKASNDLLPFFAEAFFEEKIKQNPDNLLNYIALGEVFLKNDKSYEGITVLKKAEQMAPKSSYVSYRLSDGYTRAKNQTNSSREIEKIKQNDPESYIALSNLFSDAMRTQKHTDAESIATKIKSLYGENYESDMRSMSLLSAHKKSDELVQLIRQLHEKYPSDNTITLLLVMMEENLLKNSKKATAVLEDYSKENFSESLVGQLASRYVREGERDKGLELYRKRIELLPHLIGNRLTHASLLQGMQKYEEALFQLSEVKKQAPYLASIYSFEGHIYKEMKDIDKSREAFKKSIYYNPNLYDSRTQLRLLDNKGEIFDLFPKTNLDSLIENSPVQSDYPESSAVIVLDEMQFVFYSEGAQEVRTTLCVKMLTQKAIGVWKNYRIGYGSGQRLILDKYEIIKANGQRVKAETNNQGIIVFTNIEVGDYLHLDYRIQSNASGVFAKHFNDCRLIQAGLPKMRSSYSILLPKDKDFKYVVKNFDVKPSVADVEDMKLYQWETKDEPAIKEEISMSPMIDVYPTFVFSSVPDWRFVGEWYRDLTTNKISAESDYVLEETHAEILKGKENASQIEKAKLFYEYILNNINYLSVSFMQSNLIPQKASRTITTRLGDCKDVSTLFVTLCRRSGIKANLVLLNSRQNGKNKLALPSIAFNHCIAQLEVDGKTYFLELTDKRLPFGAALDQNLQSDILPIPYKDEPAVNSLLVMDMPFRMRNSTVRQTKITVTNNDMNIGYKNVRWGQLASFMRRRSADMGLEDQLKDMTQSIAKDWSTPVKVSNLNFTNLDNLADSVIYTYDLEIANALQDVAGMKILRLPWSDAVRSLEIVALETRRFPLEFWTLRHCDSEDEVIELTLPQGKKLTEMPQNIKLECSVASYELTFSTDKSGELRVRRYFVKKKDVVSPEEYNEFRIFMNAVSENDNKQYAIK